MESKWVTQQTLLATVSQLSTRMLRHFWGRRSFLNKCCWSNGHVHKTEAGPWSYGNMKNWVQSGVVAHACDPNSGRLRQPGMHMQWASGQTRLCKVGRQQKVQDQPGAHSELRSSQGRVMRPCFRQTHKPQIWKAKNKGEKISPRTDIMYLIWDLNVKTHARTHTNFY